jgi:hypothetical protein
MNGWVTRTRSLAEILGTPAGILAVLILMCIAVGRGWLPFPPMDRLSDAIEKQNGITAREIDERASDNLELRVTLKALLLTMSRMERRTQIIDCAPLKDVDLRRRCLE